VSRKTEPVFIHTVATDLRSGPGRPDTIDLGPRTVLVGRNGIGKTRITNSIELGLSSVADDLLGKSGVKAPADLLLASSSDLGSITVRLAFATGDTKPWADASYSAAYTAAGKAPRQGNASRPPGVDPAWALPVRTVHGWLTRGPEKARELFLPYIAGTVSADDIQRALPAIYVAPLENGKQTPESVDALLAMTDLAAKRKKEERDRSKAAEEHAQRLRSDTHDPEPSDDQIALAQAAVEDAQAILEASSRTANSGVLDEKRATLAECERTIDARFPRPAPLPPEPTLDLPPQQRAFFSLLTGGVSTAGEALGLGLTRCVCCGSPNDADKHAAWQAQVNEWLGEVRQQHEAHKAALAAWEQQKAYHDQVAQNRTQAEVYVTGLRAEIAALEEAQGGVSNAAVTVLPVEEARELFAGAQAALQALTALRERWASIRQSDNIAIESKRLEEWWKGYSDALAGVVSELLDTSLQGFLDTVQRYMPRDRKAALVLRDGTRQVFKVGLVENGKLNLAPSGVEWAMLLFAMTAAVLDRLPDGPPKYACFMLPEERAFDPYTASEVMRALRDLPYQIILTCTTKPKRAPKDWLVVDLDEISKGLLADAEADDGEGDDSDDSDDADADASESTALPLPPEAGTTDPSAPARDVKPPPSPSAGLPGGLPFPPSEPPPGANGVDKVQIAITTLATLDPNGEHRPWHESEDACRTVHEALTEAGCSISLAGVQDVVEVAERRWKPHRGHGGPEATAK
jgi:hypothetical protein